MTILAAADWREREGAHTARADALTAGHRARTARRETHPIEDFLFTYYAYSPSLLRRWHPGAGVELADASGETRSSWRWYTPGATPGSLIVDAAAMRREKAPLLTAVERILRSTVSRPGAFGCFGLHEWAMVYRQREHRHPVPLRLGQGATDEVVDAHELRCTHIDAYRFFTPDATPRNRFAPTRETQPDLEQPGCLHANMDVYKWAVKLGPLVPGELLLDAFELARDIRYLDMQASPYDMAPWGGEPVRIETAEGKAQYVRRQRGFAERANELRRKVLAAAFGTGARTGAGAGAAPHATPAA
ncbi:3-methyladenine DNA glycosylase [Agromyces aerolatus]|uniref:3-methyladenine DNA glycosylase n=1 Tax=Agromyces sp. LY-1074 TaxID=3074080 RepID=UPI00286046BE|nr:MULTISPECIES: 3-methyladenine DNA glycosylase [unclassified Agromyces]MDR5699660.1 3-methyladenine DNA glycosylase [Agromyces sp. LY-1074]MDR5705956.1 3-methyladenine DNA glycosylase [Agromyces sp. LY-1358]